MTAATTADPQIDLPTSDVGSMHRRRVLGLMASAGVLVLAAVLSLAIGSHGIGLWTVWQALWDYTDNGDQWIVHELRVPRTIVGILVGVALGVSGALIQGITRKPLADS